MSLSSFFEYVRICLFTYLLIYLFIYVKNYVKTLSLNTVKTNWPTQIHSESVLAINTFTKCYKRLHV